MGCADVSPFLKAGDNEIALQLQANLWQGRIFLSQKRPMSSLTERGKNRLWLLWRRWLIDTPIEDMSIVFDGMRQADPNRPIKIMAPIHLGPSRYVKMARQKRAPFPTLPAKGCFIFPV